MTKVVLLEFIDEFEEFQRFISTNGLDINEFNIVALEYKLQAYLKKSGVNFKNTLSYLNNNSLERILLKFEDIRVYIEKNFDFTDKNGLKNAYVTELQHYIELIFNYIAKILEILQNIYKEDNSVKLYICAKSFLSASIFIANDRPLRLLVEQFARKNNINFYAFGNSCKHEEVSLNRNLIVEKFLIYKSFLNILNIYLKIFKKHTVIVPTKDYGFKQVIDAIGRRNPNVMFITLYDKENIKWYKRYAGLISGLISNNPFIDVNALPCNIDLYEQDILKEKVASLFSKKNESVFEFNGVDFSDIMREKVNAGIKEHLCKMLQWSYQLHYFIQRFGVKLLISPFGRGIWYILAELLHKIGRISLFVSHGTHPVPTNKYHEISIFNMCRGFMLGDYSHIALSTPVQEVHLRYFKNKYEWLRNEEIKTGPLIFADIKEAERWKNRASFGFLPHEKIIVHAVSLKWRGMERFYFLETIDEYFAGLADFACAVNKLDNAKLVIRLHPGFDLSDEDLKLFLPQSDKYVISKSGEFETVLSTADLLVSYSSTTIDEALINKIPVLLYDKWNRYNHFRTSAYDGSASSDFFPLCYVNNSDQLNDALSFMLKRADIAKKDEIDVSKYRYEEAYKDNFYEFVAESMRKRREEQ